MSYTPEELEGLTDEERAALQEPDDTTTTMENAYEEPKDKGDEGEDKTDAGDANQGDSKAAADDQGPAGADDGGNGDGGDAITGEDGAAPVVADAGKPAPIFVAEAPADASEKLAAIGQQKGDLAAKFEDGDITAKEFQSELDKLAKQERDIERAVDKAQIASEMRQQQEVNNWMSQVTDFTTKAQPEYSTSKARWLALDAFVKEIGQDPANANLSGAQILAEAHKRVVEDLGEVQAKAKQDPANKPPLKGSKAEAPKTLAKVPAAQGNDVDDTRWTSLDRLQSSDPEAHEEALMKLSASERDAYLSR